MIRIYNGSLGKRRSPFTKGKAPKTAQKKIQPLPILVKPQQFSNNLRILLEKLKMTGSIQRFVERASGNQDCQSHSLKFHQQNP
jgi:hypothetical protein